MLELKKKSMAREVWQCTKCGATYGTNIGRCGCEVAEEKRRTRTLNSKRTKKMAMPKGTAAKEPKSTFHRFSGKEEAGRARRARGRSGKKPTDGVFVIDHKAVHLFSVKVFLHDAFI